MQFELAIIGGGPAAYSAGIYAVRAGIKPIIFEKDGGGGLAIFSPNMSSHAKKYCEIRTFEKVKKIQKINNMFRIETIKGKYTSKAVIICTGSEYRKLEIKGESELQGKGVSYCATCDGFFFKDKKVAVIGGGNSALIEAIYLKQIGCKEVTLIHRRDQLRAEKAYEDEAKKNKVNFLFNKKAIEINGSDQVESILLRDTITSKEMKINNKYFSF